LVVLQFTSVFLAEDGGQSVVTGQNGFQRLDEFEDSVVDGVSGGLEWAVAWNVIVGEGWWTFVWEEDQQEVADVVVVAGTESIDAWHFDVIGVAIGTELHEDRSGGRGDDGDGSGDGDGEGDLAGDQDWVGCNFQVGDLDGVIGVKVGPGELLQVLH